jgi:hypothetical protein
MDTAGFAKGVPKININQKSTKKYRNIFLFSIYLFWLKLAFIVTNRERDRTSGHICFRGDWKLFKTIQMFINLRDLKLTERGHEMGKTIIQAYENTDTKDICIYENNFIHCDLVESVLFSSGQVEGAKNRRKF